MTDCTQNNDIQRRVYRSIVNNENCKNPFRITKMEDYHRNFPPFESVFAVPEQEQELAEAQDEVSLLNLSTVSSSILSISGRAAMNAHNRRVARFGIDGEQEQHKPFASFNGVTATTKTLRDEAWEALNQSVDVQSSSLSSDYSLSNEVSTDHDRHRIVVSNTPDGSEEIEVTTDEPSIALDTMFFQSEKVESLRTPERYKTPAISSSPTRREMGLNNHSYASSHDAHPSNDSMTSSTAESETRAMLRLALSAAAGHHANTSTSSYSASSSIGSAINQRDRTEIPMFDISSTSSRHASRHPYTLPPSLSFSEQASDVGDCSTINGSFLLNQSAISTCSSDHHVSTQQRKPPRPPNWEQNHSLHHESPMNVKPSPSPRLASLLQSESVHTVPLTPPRTATSFLATSNSPNLGNENALSPIRPCEADDSSEGSSLLYRQYCHSNEAGCNGSPLLSNSIDNSRSRCTFDDNDPRLYRTVVPSRVFITDDGDDFPSEHDSFSPRDATVGNE